MKPIWKRMIGLLVLLAVILPVLPGNTYGYSEIITDPTGYTSASDVMYVTDGNYIANWGARGEECVFLSTYASAFYIGDYTFEALSAKEGSDHQNSVPGSELYTALQALMQSRHTHETTYGETRYEYCYTDCLKSDTSQITSFYSGKMFSSKWDQGKTWNREHTWPASKSLTGRPSNGDDGESSDIMMLRPTLSSENGSRGNTAYGVSSGYHDPGVSVRGDCARIALYVYVRWGNTKNMWGQKGVIENLELLLKWMEEDPVDTWEMGRNDAVQSITGTRNVFVDYPELAWLLFGRSVPAGMSTPSGGAGNSGSNNDTGDSGTGDNTGNGGSTEGSDNTESTEATELTTPCAHENTEVLGYKTATCSKDGYSGDTYCSDCQALLSTGTAISATGVHNLGDWSIIQEETATEDGIRERSCTKCGFQETEQIPATGAPTQDPPTEDSEPTEVTEPTETSEPSETTESMETTQPTQDAEPTENTQPTVDSQPTDSTQPSEDPKPEKPDNSPVIIAVVAVVGCVAAAAVIIVIIRKKKV